MQPPTKKRRTCSRKRPLINTEDRISGLPDAVLHITMSFLPVKEAVSTCILSSCWRRLWASMPYLSFPSPSGPYNTNYEFESLLDHILLFRDRSHVYAFRLLSDTYFPLRLADSWIRYVLMHKVQELTLRIRGGLSQSVLKSIFSCRSLRVLRMDCTVHLHLDHAVHLSELKELHLARVYWDDGLFKRLVSGCPILENLHLEDCNSKGLDICANELRSLDLVRCHADYGRVYAPNLISFNYFTKKSTHGYWVNDFALEGLAYLSHVSLDIDSGWNSMKVSKIFKGLHNAKDLTPSSLTIMVICSKPLRKYKIEKEKNVVHALCSVCTVQYAASALQHTALQCTALHPSAEAGVCPVQNGQGCVRTVQNKIPFFMQCAKRDTGKEMAAIHFPLVFLLILCWIPGETLLLVNPDGILG